MNVQLFNAELRSNQQLATRNQIEMEIKHGVSVLKNGKFPWDRGTFFLIGIAQYVKLQL